MSNWNVSEKKNTNRRATKPSVLCRWSKNKQNKVKTRNCNSFADKKQLEGCCGNSVRKKIQNQRVDVLDYIKTIKTKNDRGIGYHESKQNEIFFKFLYLIHSVNKSIINV